MANLPFKLRPSVDRNVRGQFTSPPAPTPMATRQEAERSGTDVNSLGEQRRRAGLYPDHPTQNGATSGPMLPWPAAVPGAPSPMRLKD